MIRSSTCRQSSLPPHQPSSAAFCEGSVPRERAKPLVFHARRREEEPLEKSRHKSAAVTEAMGNKSSAPSKGADAGGARGDEAVGAAAGQI